jgi:hypothetical protein
MFTEQFIDGMGLPMTASLTLTQSFNSDFFSTMAFVPEFGIP